MSTSQNVNSVDELTKRVKTLSLKVRKQGVPKERIKLNNIKPTEVCFTPTHAFSKEENESREQDWYIGTNKKIGIFCHCKSGVYFDKPGTYRVRSSRGNPTKVSNRMNWSSRPASSYKTVSDLHPIAIVPSYIYSNFTKQVKEDTDIVSMHTVIVADVSFESIVIFE